MKQVLRSQSPFFLNTRQKAVMLSLLITLTACSGGGSDGNAGAEQSDASNSQATSKNNPNHLTWDSDNNHWDSADWE